MRLYLVFVHLPLFLLVFTSNGPLQAEVKVACVGDSITEGLNLGDRSYPSRLGSLLGDSYTVHNYGAAGYAVLSKSDMPYRTTADIKQASLGIRISFSYCWALMIPSQKTGSIKKSLFPISEC